MGGLQEETFWDKCSPTFVTCLIEPSSKEGFNVVKVFKVLNWSIWSVKKCYISTVQFSWSFWYKSLKSSMKLFEVSNWRIWSPPFKSSNESFDIFNQSTKSLQLRYLKSKYLKSLLEVFDIFNSYIFRFYTVEVFHWSCWVFNWGIWSLRLKHLKSLIKVFEV